MLSALYLDPRYRISISNEKAIEARAMLTKIWRRLQVLKSSPSIHNQSNISVQSCDSFDFEFDEHKAVMQHLKLDEIGQNTLDPQCTDIETIIESFQPLPISLDSSILEYWESVKDCQNQLYELAMAVFSVPPSEVQIERDFSSLKFIFTDRRCNLTQARLEAILIIHLNKDLFYQVVQEQVNEIRS